MADIDDYYKKTDPKPLIFCHFARGLGDKVYNEVTEFKALYKTLMEVIALAYTAAFFTFTNSCMLSVLHSVLDVKASTLGKDSGHQQLGNSKMSLSERKVHTLPDRTV